MRMVGAANGVCDNGSINGNNGRARGQQMSGPNSDEFAVSTGIIQGISPPQHQLQSSEVDSGIAPRPTSMSLAAAVSKSGREKTSRGVISSNSNIKQSGGSSELLQS